MSGGHKNTTRKTKAARHYAILCPFFANSNCSFSILCFYGQNGFSFSVSPKNQTKLHLVQSSTQGKIETVKLFVVYGSINIYDDLVPT